MVKTYHFFAGLQLNAVYFHPASSVSSILPSARGGGSSASLEVSTSPPLVAAPPPPPDFSLVALSLSWSAARVCDDSEEAVSLSPLAMVAAALTVMSFPLLCCVAMVTEGSVDRSSNRCGRLAGRSVSIPRGCCCFYARWQSNRTSSTSSEEKTKYTRTIVRRP